MPLEAGARSLAGPHGYWWRVDAVHCIDCRCVVRRGAECDNLRVLFASAVDQPSRR